MHSREGLLAEGASISLAGDDIEGSPRCFYLDDNAECSDWIPNVSPTAYGSSPMESLPLLQGARR